MTSEISVLSETRAMIKKRIYLDYNSTAPLLPQAAGVMEKVYSEASGNPSSMYEEGRHARHWVEESRSKVAKGLGVRRDQIIFTGGGSEAINLAVKGAAFAFQKKGKHIITSAIEHSANSEACQYLADHFGFRLTVLPADSSGVISADDFKEAIEVDTILASLIHVQNEVGTLQPVGKIVKEARERGILIHLDGVQAFGKIPVNLGELMPDLYSVTAHKIGGPKGVGALYIKDDLKIHPLIHGGHHERDLRAGTENVAGIAAFGKAVEIALDEAPAVWEKISELKNRLWQGLNSGIEGCHVNGDLSRSVGNTLNISFEKVDGLALALSLDLEGIAVSTGSACLSGGIEPSVILKAMGIESDRALGAVRFSLGKENTPEEIDFTVETTAKIVERLRNQ
jgi:cysteine desulfurase